jgi:hypothetical protein
MKRKFYYLLSIVILFTSCEISNSEINADLDEINQALTDHESRLSDLEKKMKILERDLIDPATITNLIELVNNLESKNYVVSYSQIVEDGEIVGNDLIFADGTKIFINNVTHAIFDIGHYYPDSNNWYFRINGEYLLDDKGLPIKVGNAYPVLGITDNPDIVTPSDVVSPAFINPNKDYYWVLNGKALKTIDGDYAKVILNNSNIPIISMEYFEGALCWKVNGDWLMYNHSQIPVSNEAKNAQITIGYDNNVGYLKINNDWLLQNNKRIPVPITIKNNELTISWEDGKYYWKIDNVWVLDENNNKIPAIYDGPNGENGLTMKVVVKDGNAYWGYEDGSLPYFEGKPILVNIGTVIPVFTFVDGILKVEVAGKTTNLIDIDEDIIKKAVSKTPSVYYANTMYYLKTVDDVLIPLSKNKFILDNTYYTLSAENSHFIRKDPKLFKTDDLIKFTVPINFIITKDFSIDYKIDVISFGGNNQTAIPYLPKGEKSKFVLLENGYNTIEVPIELSLKIGNPVNQLSITNLIILLNFKDNMVFTIYYNGLDLIWN